MGERQYARRPARAVRDAPSPAPIRGSTSTSATIATRPRPPPTPPCTRTRRSSRGRACRRRSTPTGSSPGTTLPSPNRSAADRPSGFPGPAWEPSTQVVAGRQQLISTRPRSPTGGPLVDRRPSRRKPGRVPHHRVSEGARGSTPRHPCDQRPTSKPPYPGRTSSVGQSASRFDAEVRSRSFRES